MKPRRRRLSLVGMLVVGLLPVVWFLTDWGVFTICLPVLSMSKHLRPQIHLARPLDCRGGCKELDINALYVERNP